MKLLKIFNNFSGRLKIIISFLILSSVLNCSKINEKIEEKLYEQQREAMRKIDSVMMSRYKDSVMIDLDKQLKVLDSVKTSSDSALIELNKKIIKQKKKKNEN